MSEEITREEGLREQAITHLKKRRDFRAHLLVYVLVNSVLVAIWALSGQGFFWPAIILGGWGVGVVMNAWDVYFGDDFTEESIQREMEHLQNRR
ncbi:MAG TPA: 2TM domain-containing protein [Nocardioides sp.]|nr:2TM domain-containing protein [Nocardioides sp.]